MAEIEIDVSQVKAGDVLYWQSVGAFVMVSAAGSGPYGYTFDVQHLGHTEQARYRRGARVKVRREQDEKQEEFPMSDRKAMQLETVYGPCARFSEYKRGQTVRYRDEHGQETSGLIVWVASPQEIAGSHEPTSYIVENTGRAGFPDVILQSDILP